jgi:hypothetical protein
MRAINAGSSGPAISGKFGERAIVYRQEFAGVVEEGRAPR